MTFHSEWSYVMVIKEDYKITKEKGKKGRKEKDPPKTGRRFA
jgi:hypothetical protein